MALQCAITGEVPKEPVISPKSGAVFERSAIVKQIASTGADPVNDEPLSEEELIAIKTPEFSVPRPPNATSLPALLKSFQDEWDASMLESFELKKQNQQLRQELTQSLYQYDASTRVIARLIKERDQARQALSTLQPNGVTPAASAPAAPQDTGMDVADESANSTLPAEAVSAIEATAATLSKGRKKRAKPADLASPDAISGLASSHKQSGLHSSRSGVITSMAVQASRNLIVTGGSDKTANVFDYEKQEKVHTLKGHTKKVWSVDAHASEAFAVTGSADKSIGFWNLEDGSGTQRINVHSSDVTGVAIHPTGQHVLSCSKDNSWAFIDINTATSLGQTTDDDSTNGLNCIQAHPDGAILGVGSSNNVVSIWKSTDLSRVAKFEGHTGPITALAFSENGYYLASASEDSTVKLWDLRKLKNIHTIEYDAGHDVNALSFDSSGTYLAVGGSDVRAYVVKKWDELVKLDEHSKAVHAVAWLPSATRLMSAGADNTVVTYA